MTGTRPAEILRHLDQPGPDDRALLARFGNHADQAAFAELVRRHSPLVWAACLRVAGHRQDAEDAFQAVFLVLVRRVAGIRNPDLLGNWLYGVAVRVAMKARRSAARRRAREVQVPTMPEPPAPPSLDSCSDLTAVIDEELAKLAECYREAIVLCDLRGVSREEAARLLGIPEGTLSSRLANGRKKLAARLARRGIALSAIAIPGALASGARAAVPTELLAKACAVANGTGFPPAINKLASGEFTMTTKLFFGVMGAAAMVAGAVFAAQPGEKPLTPADPQKPQPPAVAKGDPAPPQKTDPEAKPDEKVAFTTSPKMRYGRDSRVTNPTRLIWSPDGKMIAHQGTWQPAKGGNATGGNSLAVNWNFSDSNDSSTRIPLEKSQNLVGFTNDSKAFILEQREYDLVSGFHRLIYTSLDERAPNPGGFGGGGERVTKDVNLDADDTRGYAFVPDGKTFRTVAFALTGTKPQPTWKITVVSVDASTGKTLKSVMNIEGEFGKGHTLSPDGKRLAVIDSKEKERVVVYDVDTAKQLWSKGPLVTEPAFGLQFSPGGNRLVVFSRYGQLLVFDGKTGDQLPVLDQAENLSPTSISFSADGRLLAMSGVQRQRSDFGGYDTTFLGVWDTETGKLLKKWNRKALVAFHPSQPILAILEPNGESGTRLGVWDFAAEPEKK